MNAPSTPPTTGAESPTPGREIAAGATTFFTMAYIAVVNPAIISASGMPVADVFFATCVSAAVATAVMGLWARYPFALAPGMGLNAFFAFTVCGAYGVPWSTALAAVLVSGVLFLALSLVGLREKLIAAIPPTLVRATAAGIGLFIAFIGLQHAGVVAKDPETMVSLGDLGSPSTLIALGGVALTAVLVAARVPGAILIGIGATAAAAVLTGTSPPPEGIAVLPSLPTETLGAAVSALPDLLRPEIALVIFTMLFLDLFDTMGTLLALGYGTGSIGVILTGMGSDGLKGVQSLKRKGAYCIAQDEATCVVYGMPRAIVENGLADEILPLSDIGRRINTLAGAL